MSLPNNDEVDNAMEEGGAVAMSDEDIQNLNTIRDFDVCKFLSARSAII